MDIVNGLRGVKRTVASFSLAALIASTFAIGVAQAQTFPDVNPSDWFYSYVEDLVALGVVNGSMPEYRPADNVNRAEMAKLVVEAFEIDLVSPATATFKDVVAGTWYYEYVETAAAHGIVGGYKDSEGTLTGYYGPGDSLTREQAAKMIVFGAPLDINTNCGPSFPDVAMNQWSYEYVETLYVNSVIDGYPDGTFGPNNNINRAEIAKIVSNAMAPVLRPCGGFSAGTVEALSATTVEVCFTGNYDETSAMMVENYMIEDQDGNELAVTNVEATSDPNCVLLTTDAQDSTKVYDLMVSDVMGADGMELLNGTATFNGYSVGDVGALTVDLDGSTPDAASIPRNGSNILFTVFGFNASADEDVKIEELIITRQGLGLPGDFKNLKLYVNGVQKGSEKTLNTSTNSATFALTSDPIVVPAGKRLLVEVRADMDATVGSQNKLCLATSDDVTAFGGTTDKDVAVGGSFAICGNAMSSTSAEVGTLEYTVTQPSTGEINIGDTDVSFVRVKLDEKNEDVNVKRITFRQGGSAEAEYFANLRLVASGVTLDAVKTWDGRYVTFDLSANPLFIAKGNSRTIELWGDVVGGLNTTVQFDIYRDWHIEGTGTVYGYGVNVTRIASAAIVARNIVGGNIAFATSANNPVTGDVAKGARDHEFLRFNISTAGDGVTVRKLTLVVNAGGGGTAAHIEDLKIWGKNSKGEWAVVAGPNNVTALGQITFTDTFDVPALTTTEFRVTADITNTALNGMQFSVDLDDVTDANLTELEYLSDGTGVDEATEVTGGILAGNLQTVAEPSVTVTIAGTPGDSSYVKNTVDRDLVAFNLQASTADDISITALTVLCENGAGNCSNAFQSLNLYLVEGATLTKLAGPRSVTTTVAPAGEIVFSLNHTITAGNNARLLVRGDIGSAAAAGTYDFTIFAAGKVTAEDSEFNSATVNGAFPLLPARQVTVAGQGTFANTGLLDDETQERILIGNSANESVLKVTFAADTLEGWVVKKMTFNEIYNAPISDRDFVELKVTYLNKAGETKTAVGAINGGTYTFNNLDAYIPAGTERTLLVSLDVAEVKTSGAVAGDIIQLQFDATTSTFEIIGESSGTQVTEADGIAVDVTGDAMRIAKTSPTVTVNDVPATLADGERTMYDWTIAANSAGNVAIKQIAFDTSFTGFAVNDVNTFRLYKNGALVSNSANIQILAQTGADLKVAAPGVVPTKVIVRWDAGAISHEEIVSTSSRYELKAVMNAVVSGDSVTTAMADDVAGAVGLITDAAGTDTIEVGPLATESNFVWSDRSVVPHSAILGASSPDWMDGWLVKGLSSAGSQVVSKT